MQSTLYSADPLPPARPVSEGSHLAIVAPASPFNSEFFQAGCERLSERYRVSYQTDIFSQDGYKAGDDERRSRELLEALSDPTVDAIVCARGGFGATRLLPQLSLQQIHMANKMIVGFSDITALHAIWMQAGVRSVHASMVAALASASDSIYEQWIQSLEHPDKERSWTLSPLVTGTAVAPITGGNLTVLSALLGTHWQPDLQGRILFIEDVGERPYRTDRVLTSMQQAGLFQGLAGLVVGAFTEASAGVDGVEAVDVIHSHFAEAPFPVLTDFPGGHIDENEPIPFGVTARIDGDQLQILRESKTNFAV